MKENLKLNLLVAGEQNQDETYLTEENVLLLKRMFKDKNSYSYYMRSLWILRNMTRNLCERETPVGVMYDKQHEMFPVLKLTNELIGALGRENAYVFNRGDEINCMIDDEIYNIYTLD